MQTVNMLGMDVGFRKTGLTVFRVSAEGDELVAADTIYTGDDVASSVLIADVLSCMTWCERLDEFVSRHAPKVIFAEIPHGGAQGARANRCMGLATALAAAYIHYRPVEFEFFSPHAVEKALGVALLPGDAKKLSKGERTAWKKERLARMVLREWPDFRGWPSTKRLKEDAIDSAAAFLCGRITSSVYKMAKQRATGSSTSQTKSPAS